MSMFYDEELPAGFQDADFEQRELEMLGNRAAANRKRGICNHGSWVGYHPDFPARNLKRGQVRCTELCQKVFVNEEDIMQAHREALGI
jgi:hypothetical protein